MDHPLILSASSQPRVAMSHHVLRSALLTASAITLTGCNAVMTPIVPTSQQQAISLQAAAATVAAGGVDMFTAIQQGSQLSGGQWAVTGAPSNGTIDVTGLYHAPASLATPAPVTINYLMGTQTSSITVTIVSPSAPVTVVSAPPAPVTIVSAPSAPVTVQPGQPTVQVQGTDAFVAVQQGAPVTGGQWVVLGGSSNGSIDANGNYVAPSLVPTPSTISVGYIVGSGISMGTVTVVDAAPAILSVSPAQLTRLSSAVDVTGSGFLPGSILSIGAAQVPTTYIDASHLSATVTLASALNVTLPITVTNPGDGFSQSNAYDIQAVFPAITIQPATLVGGPITLAISGTSFASGDIVTLNGSPLLTTINSSTSITATGFLTPWSVGSVVVQVSAGDGAQPIAAQTIPIQQTPVTYDAASRFATQAAMGQRPDIVQSIQSLGFNAWITQQFQQPAISFSVTRSAKTQLIDNALFGSSLLRQRLALALQSFIVPHDEDFDPSAFNFEDTLEQDSSGNFRDLLTDVTSDPNVTTFLNLPGNRAADSSFAQPNQNFARELMQLFTLGPFLLNDDGSTQVDSQGNPIPTYTQDTVIDLTRALTGWGDPVLVNPVDTMWGIDFSQPLTSTDTEWAHDENAKLLFGTVILPAGQTAIQDRQMALDAIFNHPNVPPFISHLLIQRLVKSNPSPAYIQRISTVFENNGVGVRGDLTAVVRAILLDPEARAGDTTLQPSDGFLQEPFLWQVSTMAIVGAKYFDDQVDGIAGAYGENLWDAPTVFGLFSPAYIIPGTTIGSPEFQLQNNISVIEKSSYVWQLISVQAPGGSDDSNDTSWLLQNFTTVPAMLDALNHLVYHGQMSQAEQAAISNYCSQLNPFQTQYQLQIAMFLALNADSYNVAH
jgi:uncharacterized protein (DUF1800 family)